MVLRKLGAEGPPSGEGVLVRAGELARAGELEVQS